MEYDRFAKPEEPFMVIDYRTSKCKTFKTLEEADLFAMEYSCKVENLVLVTEGVLKIDGYRCVVQSGYKGGIYIDAVKNEIMVHYIFYFSGGRIDD